jgi:hypothetical protein
MVTRGFGATFHLEVESSCINITIDVIKGMIHEKGGWPPDKQRLMFKDRKLFEGRTLGDYGIQSDCFLYLFFRGSSSVSSSASSLPPALISFRDHFAGTTVTVSSPHIPWLPDEQAALVQVTRPLQLMKAAAWFVGRRWPAAGRQRHRQQPLPPLDCLRDGCPARVPVRAMFGCVATACRRLASAPGDGTTWCFASWIMERVSRGRVRRVQVQPQRRAAVSRHMFLCFVTGCCSKRWLTCRWRAAKRRSSMHRAASRRAFPPTRCLQCAVAASLGRYAAPGKHVVTAAPQPAASNLRAQTSRL